jgi:hypothetical protein
MHTVYPLYLCGYQVNEIGQFIVKKFLNYAIVCRLNRGLWPIIEGNISRVCDERGHDLGKKTLTYSRDREFRGVPVLNLGSAVFAR